MGCVAPCHGSQASDAQANEVSEAALPLQSLIDALAALAAADYLRAQPASANDADDECAERVPLQAGGRGA